MKNNLNTYLLITLWLTSCAAPSLHVTTPATIPPDITTWPNATLAQWPADPARLTDDIRRVIRQMHFGVLFVDQTAPPPAARITAAALLDNARRADITAWQIDDITVAIAIRIGLRGDPQLEKNFITKLTTIMAGKPKRQYRGIFRLPF